jgi:nucleotide-binding universal stress UspA family protein
MAGSTFTWVALGVWLVGGLGGYYYLYRHGHPHPGWLLAAMILGPFSMLVFTDRVESAPEVLVHEGAPSTVARKVLVGIDGSPESEHALELAQRVLGDEQCCLVLCEVVDYDTAEQPGGAGVDEATTRLQDAAARLAGRAVSIEVLAGRPVQALAEAAERHDAEMIVVGTRGRGVSRRMLGSVAEGLLTVSTRPVMVTHLGTG